MDEDSDNNNTNISRQPDNEGGEIKGGWVLYFCIFGFCFAVGFFLKKHFYHKEIGYYLQIKHNKGFLSQKEKLCHNFGFFRYLS